MNPAAQLHIWPVQVPGTRVHCPPFRHGLLVHGFGIAENMKFCINFNCQCIEIQHISFVDEFKCSL